MCVRNTSEARVLSHWSVQLVSGLQYGRELMNRSAPDRLFAS